MLGRVATIAVSVAADALRRKIAWVVAFFALILTIAIPFLPSYGAGVIEGVFREISLAVMFVAALVIVLSLTANLVPGQVERRYVYGILAKPVARRDYIMGAWLGVAMTMAWVVAAFATIVCIAGWFEYGSPMWQIYQGAFAIWLESSVIGAFVIALSTRIGPLPTVLASLVFLFAGHARSALLTPDDGLLWSIYPSLDAFNVVNQVAHGAGVTLGYAGGMLLVFIGYIGLLILLAVGMFERRDL